MDLKKKTYWNGIETPACRGTATVDEAREFPQYWARLAGLIGDTIPVVRIDLEGVNAGGGVAYLDNRDGSAWNKITQGKGGPGYGHRNVAIVEGSFKEDDGSNWG